MNVKKIVLLACLTYLLGSCQKDRQQMTSPDAPINTMETDKAHSADRILFTDKQVAEFEIGGVIPLWEGANTDFDISKELIEESSEGETYQVVNYQCSKNGEQHLTLIPHFDLRTQEYNEIISEIIIHSKEYTTAEGIHVGAKISEFQSVYPDAKAYYSYVSESVWLSVNQSNVQFHLDPAMIEDLEVSSDLEEIPLSSIDTKARIENIRIYDHID